MNTKALIAIPSVGWALTLFAWGVSSYSADQPTAGDHQPTRTMAASVLPSRGVRPVKATQPCTVASATAPAGAGAELQAQVEEQVRAEIMDEIAAERKEHRARRSEQRLEGVLDRVDDFVAEQNLPADVQAQLSTAVSTMHDRFVQIHEQEDQTRGRGERGGPGRHDPEILDAMESAFSEMSAEAEVLLDDPDLSDAFADHMLPPPLRHRP